MSQFKKPYLIVRIEYVNGDEVTHTAENGYLCDQSDCICRSERETQLHLSAYFQRHPGTLASHHHEMEVKRVSAHLTDQTPTDILPPAPEAFQRMFEPGEDAQRTTWRFPRLWKRRKK